MQHQSQHIRFDACVMVPGPRTCYATIELRNAPKRSFAVESSAGDHVIPQSIEIAPTVPVFPKIDARRHMQEIPDWSRPVLCALKARHVVFDLVVDRFDRPLGYRNTDQYADDRFDHRLRDEPVMVPPTVLVAFEKDLIILADQQASDGVTRHVVGQRMLSSAKSVPNLAK